MNLQNLLKPRHQDSHKGDYGHVLVIGGDMGMPGAARMAAEAAGRVGAGLVTVATRPEHVSIVVAGRPELMAFPVKKASQLLPLLKRATVVVLGPGLSPESAWSKSLVKHVLKSPLPMIVDAGALSLLTSRSARDNWILTPHPGEAARLLKTQPNIVQQDRLKTAKTLQQKYSGIIVLKGQGTIVQDNSQEPFICAEGNPGMATGGMGDILSGVIAGLIAQGLNLRDAAAVGVLIHARAGDLVAAAAGERGMLATDLMPYLRALVNPE